MKNPSQIERTPTRNAARRAALSFAVLLAVAAAGCATPDRPDPLEPMNRKVFAFNEGLDAYVLAPVATAWDFVVPEFVQTGLDNFFTNLAMPVTLANNILQLKPEAAVWDIARILQNTTLGVGGFFDIATMVGIPENDEDFGQTLGYYGVPSGPYLMVPLLGPFTLRDGVGEIVDTTATGYLYGNLLWMNGRVFPSNGLSTFQTTGISIGQTGVQLLNLRSIFDEEIEESRKDAFDYYVFVRNAYLQSRAAKIADQSDAPVLDEDDLYFFDEDEESEDDDEENYDEL